MENEFVLYVEGPVEDLMDELYEAECDDAGIENINANYHRFDFIREAETFQVAVRSAVDAVNGIDGLEVVAVDNDVNATQIAERLGRTRQWVDYLIRGERGPGGFPCGVGGQRNPLYDWGNVALWLERNGYSDLLEPGEVDRALTLTWEGARVAQQRIARIIGEREGHPPLTIA